MFIISEGHFHHQRSVQALPAFQCPVCLLFELHVKMQNNTTGGKSFRILQVRVKKERYPRGLNVIFDARHQGCGDGLYSFGAKCEVQWKRDSGKDNRIDTESQLLYADYWTPNRL